MRRPAEIEVIEVPHKLVDIARRRTYALVRVGCHERNVLEAIALSCYVQGLHDGLDVADHRRVKAEAGDA